MANGYFQMVNRTFGKVWACDSINECKQIIANRQSGAFGFEVITDLPGRIEVIAVDEWEMPDTYEIYTVMPA